MSSIFGGGGRLRTTDATIVGAGPAGALLATLLAEAGNEVVVYDGRPDPRRSAIDDGRSINLTLARRGIVALDAVGVMDRVEGIAMPLRGRMVHVSDGARFHPYGRRYEDAIHSISRNGLNAILLDRAEATGRVRVEFDHRVVGVDIDRKRVRFGPGGTVDEIDYRVLYGADGANSVVRAALEQGCDTSVVTEPLDHGYKELHIPADDRGRHRLAPDALHLWPRHSFMLMAFANVDGSFTVTLFMSERGPDHSFDALGTAAGAEAFFADQFPDVVDLIPDVGNRFVAGPVGRLRTVRTTGWSAADGVCLVGDSAHTIVPFHGQGMNLALESVQLLVRCLGQSPGDPAEAFARYERDQKPNAEAIADMALANYIELRSDVIEADYLLRRQLSGELERRWPDHFASRYDLVTFTTVPFEVARRRADDQRRILDRLLRTAGPAHRVDYEAAGRMVNALGPLPGVSLPPPGLRS